jgi:hypothetical protein
MHLITFFVKWCLRYTLHWNDPWAGLPAPPNSHPRYERPSCWSAPHRGNAAGVNGWVQCTVDTKSTIDFTDYTKNGTRIFKAPLNFSTGRCPQNSAWDVRNNRWMLKIVKGCPVSIWALLLHASQNQEPTVSVVIHQYSRINLINPGSVQNLVNPDIPDVFPNRIGFCQLYQRAERTTALFGSAVSLASESPQDDSIKKSTGGLASSQKSSEVTAMEGISKFSWPYRHSNVGVLLAIGKSPFWRSMPFFHGWHIGKSCQVLLKRGTIGLTKLRIAPCKKTTSNLGIIFGHSSKQKLKNIEHPPKSTFLISGSIISLT